MSNPHRREFLQTAGSGLAACAIAPALVHAEDPAQSPSEKIVLGVMGVNGRGRALATGFAALPNCEVAYICDVDERAFPAAAKAVADRGGKPPQTVKDFRRILEDKNVHALVVAAPDHWHAPATILACAAQKHVYCEKPACHNGREGQLMIAAARKHNRVVQIGTQRRSSPKTIEAIQRVRGGDIGRALFARGWINSTRPSIGRGKQVTPPAQLDYALWQGPAPERPYKDNVVHYHWHWFWHWGTGELGNNGIHALDVCRWGLGVDYPTRVVCGGGKYHFEDDQETPDTQLATFHFEGKAIHWEHRTWHPRGFEGKQYGSVFYGEKGTLALLDDAYMLYDRAGKLLEEVKLEGGEREHLEDFLHCIRNGGKPRADVEEGVKSTTLCNLGNIAYRTGRTVNFDPAKREIVGDAEAAALWTREYRPGWEPKV